MKYKKFINSKYNKNNKKKREKKKYFFDGQEIKIPQQQNRQTFYFPCS